MENLIISSRINDLQIQKNVFLKECNAMYPYKLQHSSIGEKPIFFLEINNSGRWNKNVLGGKTSRK